MLCWRGAASLCDEEGVPSEGCFIRCLLCFCWLKRMAEGECCHCRSSVRDENLAVPSVPVAALLAGGGHQRDLNCDKSITPRQTGIQVRLIAFNFVRCEHCSSHVPVDEDGCRRRRTVLDVVCGDPSCHAVVGNPCCA